MENYTKEIETIKETRHEFTLKLIEDFKSGKQHLSYSSLKTFLESPHAFISYKMGSKKSTSQKDFGSMLHDATFKQEEFSANYISDEEITKEIGGAKPRATTKYKDWVSLQHSVGLNIVSHEDLILALQMGEVLKENEASKPLLTMVNEFEKKSEFEFNGFRFLLYHDAIGEIHLDLKSTADASFKKFTRDIFKFGYHIQSAIYSLDIMTQTGEMLPYYNVAIDKGLDVGCYKYSEDVVNFGIRKIEKGLADFQRCLDQNLFNKSFDFYSSNEGIFHVDQPAWLS